MRSGGRNRMEKSSSYDDQGPQQTRQASGPSVLQAHNAWIQKNMATAALER